MASLNFFCRRSLSFYAKNKILKKAAAFVDDAVSQFLDVVMERINHDFLRISQSINKTKKADLIHVFRKQPLITEKDKAQVLIIASQMVIMNTANEYVLRLKEHLISEYSRIALDLIEKNELSTPRRSFK